MTDRYGADVVEIVIAEHPDGTRVWLNVDGFSAARVYRIKKLTIDDRRGKREDAT